MISNWKLGVKPFSINKLRTSVCTLLSVFPSTLMLPIPSNRMFPSLPIIPFVDKTLSPSNPSWTISPVLELKKASVFLESLTWINVN